MPKNAPEFLAMMDERPWFRMIVCFLPGLILGKLGGYTNANSVFSLFATLILVAGVALYAFWGRLRKVAIDQEVEDEVVHDDQPDVSTSVAAQISDVAAQDVLTLLSQLRALCHEAARESDKLIETEIAVNPRLTFSQAVHAAITRRNILSK